MTLQQLVKGVLPAGVVERLRVARNTVVFYRQTLLATDTSTLTAALRRAGVGSGSLVFVQSAYDQMRSIAATPVELIEVLCAAVEDSGTVVMPTFPMSGLSYDYLAGTPTFDWRRTPSRSGLLTEVFRRMPGTERSLHPTHPVAARGRQAAWLTSQHERSTAPFDEHSPFQKMLDRGALIVSLGRFGAMTFRHLADHLLQAAIPYPIYVSEPTVVRAIAKDGTERVVVTRAHNPELTCNHRVVLESMARQRHLVTARAGRLPISVVPAIAYVDAYRQALDRGQLRYELKSQSAGRAING